MRQMDSQLRRTVEGAHIPKVNDSRALVMIFIQVTVMVTFIIYSLFLYHLPTIWNDKTMTSPTLAQPPSSCTVFTTFEQPGVSLKKGCLPLSTLAIDIWFALVLSAVCDAVATVTTYNRSVIDHWHYFISTRMLAFGAIASVLVATPQAIHHPITSLVAGSAIYLLIGIALNAYRKPPPTTSASARFWTLREYTVALGRTPGSWRSAIISTCVTGGLGTVLTVVVPRSSSALVPVLTVATEAVYLRINGFGRSPRYTLCAAPIFQAGVFMHWGLKQTLAVPRLHISPWAFVLLVMVGRVFLDIHIYTVFLRYPEFQWARKHAVMSNGTLVRLCLALLLLEKLHVPVITWIKPITVSGFYLFGLLGVTAPAAYLFAYGGIKKTGRAD